MVHLHFVSLLLSSPSYILQAGAYTAVLVRTCKCSKSHFVFKASILMLLYSITWLLMYVGSLTALGLHEGYAIFKFFNYCIALADIFFTLGYWFLARRYHVVAFDIPLIL